MTALSILDLVRVTEETDARSALDNARDIAVHAEAWGYRRIWVAEHHNMPGIASAATSVVIGHIAAGTNTIRVGADGIMLPNHAPYVIAEQFGTLARLFPGLSQPPIDDIESYWSPAEKAQAMSMLARSIVGSPDTVRSGMDALIAETGADELMIVSDVYEHATRLRSFELIASAARIAS